MNQHTPGKQVSTGTRNELENLRWKPMWTSHLGCLKGCLDYLKIDVSEAWLFGATGHAFILNIHEVVCPSGPTAWRTEKLRELAGNIGCEIDRVCGHKSQTDFAQKQELAWEKAREAIDAGLPCYGWGLEIPEYYVVYGYDDLGYYYSGPSCDTGKGLRPWQELGDTEIGVVEMCVVKPGEPATDNQTVKEALEFVLEHATSPKQWIFPKYKAGLAGYDLWIHALEAGKAHGMGMAYNAAVWSECRRFGCSFLCEAIKRLSKDLRPLFGQAMQHYDAVTDILEYIADAFPFEGRDLNRDQDADLRRTAAEYLTDARNAEAAGLEVLERIVTEL
ncbi:MAG: hypothetical protein ABIH23_22890 [bacterium]